MTTLELRGPPIPELLSRLADKRYARDIVLTTTRDGRNVLHWGDECEHGVHLSRPCWNKDCTAGFYAERSKP